MPYEAPAPRNRDSETLNRILGRVESNERQTVEAFTAVNERLSVLGRQIAMAATQKPANDVVPTSLRDLFGFRWALRCSTPQASDTILGQSWATQGFSASSIDAADRGVGFLLHEGLIPIRLRAFYLSDDDLNAIAARALDLRGGKVA